MLRFKFRLAACAALFHMSGIASVDPGHGTNHEEHGTMAAGVGTLNSIDAENRKVNISHRPMPAIGWKGMRNTLANAGYHLWGRSIHLFFHRECLDLENCVAVQTNEDRRS